MNRRVGTILIVLMLAIFGTTFMVNAAALEGTAREIQAQPQSLESAVTWLVSTHQNDDGGYAQFSTGANVATSTVKGTVDALLAIGATGYHPAIALVTETVSPIDFLHANSAEMQTTAQASGGDAGKLVMALVAAHQNSADFDGINYVDILASKFSTMTGQADTTVFRHSLAMIGMAAAGQPVPANAVAHLIGQQAVDGSWGDGFGTSKNADSTAMAIMALIAAGETPTSTAVANAKTFLTTAQTASGGFEYGPGFGANANSTALVIQALAALGEDFYTSGGAWDAGAGATPLAALLSFQSVTGAFQTDFGTGPFDDFFSTIGAIPAVAGRAFPIIGRYAAVAGAISCLDNLQDQPTGGWAAFEGGAADASGTSRAIQALSRAGVDLTTAQWAAMSGTLPSAALEALTPAYLSGGRGGRIGVVMQGASRVGADVTNFASMNLPVAMSGYLSPTGEYASTQFGPVAHVEALLGLVDSQLPYAASAETWLTNAAVNPGDWGSADATGSALQFFGKIGTNMLPQAGAQLLATQLADGGWGFGAVSNPSSTSEVVQGIWASGTQPYGPNWSVIVEGQVTNASDIIMAQQQNNGCWKGFGGGDDPYSTTDALIMLTVENENFIYSPVPSAVKLANTGTALPTISILQLGLLIGVALLSSIILHKKRRS